LSFLNAFSEWISLKLYKIIRFLPLVCTIWYRRKVYIETLSLWFEALFIRLAVEIVKGYKDQRFAWIKTLQILCALTQFNRERNNDTNRNKKEVPSKL
jgi:hypothetical protein